MLLGGPLVAPKKVKRDMQLNAVRWPFAVTKKEKDIELNAVMGAVSPCCAKERERY